MHYDKARGGSGKAGPRITTRPEPRTMTPRKYHPVRSRADLVRNIAARLEDCANQDVEGLVNALRGACFSAHFNGDIDDILAEPVEAEPPTLIDLAHTTSLANLRTKARQLHPDMLPATLDKVIDNWLESRGYERDDSGQWILHPELKENPPPTDDDSDDDLDF